MPTLSKVRFDFFKIGKWLGIGLAVLIGLFLLTKFLFFVKELIAPTPPPPPTVSFQKLPAIFFPQGIKKSFNYTLDTITGDLPTLSDRSYVYKMVQPGPDILAVQKASEKISTLGFDPHPEQLSDIVYRWRGSGTLSRTLILNVNLAEFNLSSSFITDPNVLSAVNLPNQEAAIGEAQNFLQTLGLYPEDIDDQKTVTKLLKINNSIITNATSISNTQLINVYFFQKDRNKVPIVYPNGKNSTMSLTIGGGGLSADGGQVVDGRFFYQKISNQSATYPIKTAAQAFEELKKGNAYIASYNGKDSNIVINNVYLGLYSEGRQQQYLMPVVVFEGNDNFVAYVSATTDEWINK